MTITPAGPAAEPLDDTYYAESYALRKAASTMTTNTLQWLRAHCGPEAAGQAASPAFDRSRPFRVLSVGPGEGDIDIEIAQQLVKALSPLGVSLHYTMLEPNPHHRALLAKRMAQLPAGCATVEVLSTRYEDAAFPEKFNLVFMIQVLYYFEDRAAALRAAAGSVAAIGKVVVVHQCYEGVPRIQAALMKRLKGSDGERFTCQDISLLLDGAGIPFGYTHLPSTLDVTPCLARTAEGDMVMSFCLECKVETAPPDLYEATLDRFRALAAPGPGGRSLLSEPAGVFVVPGYAALEHDCEEDRLSDIKDYAQLAISVDWPRWFGPLAARGGGRVLEVGCGTGRWQSAFSRLVGPRLGVGAGSPIRYDLVDPSRVAMAEAVAALRHPFALGAEFPVVVQAAPLEDGAYDVVWSMHAFYAIPRPDLAPALAKIRRALRPAAGVCVIAQPDASAFYISLYKLVIDALGIDAPRFTESADVTAALDSLGVAWRAESIYYEEIIPLADTAAAEHFVVNECITYSFSRDEATRYADLTLAGLRAHPLVGPFLEGFIQGDCWHFPQSVDVIIFGDGAGAA